MATIYESEEEDLAEILDDTDDDEDDDDYVPDGGNSDSDPEYGKRKRKSSQSSPNKRSRSSSRSSAISPNKKNQQPNKKVTSTFKSRRSNTSQKQSPNKKIQKKKAASSSSSGNTGSSSLRRSSRSTRARGVSYVDADVSEEENFDNDDISNESDNVYDSDEEISEQKKETHKQHVAELWSSFKNDVETAKKSNSYQVSENKKTEPAVPSGLEDRKLSANLNCKDTVPKTESSKLIKTVANTESKNEVTSESTKKALVVDKTINDNDSKETNEIEKLKKESKTLESSSLNEPVVKPSDEQIPDVEKDLNKTGDNPKSDDVTSKRNEVPAEKIIKSSGSGKGEGKNEVTVTETFDFAGEKITKSIVVDANSTEAKQLHQKTSEKASVPKQTGNSAGINNILTSGIKKTGGLASVLGSLDKKKKMSVLEKSKYDWDNYKQDNNLEDELRSNRSSGYLDRQEFLQRVEYKQWENEREMRLYSNHK